jgi:hypothetical protein
MKNNSQKGFIAPLLLVIIALLVIVGGVYVYQNKKAEAPIVHTQILPFLTDTNKSSIDSIFPSIGAVGTDVEIRGKNLNGFEGSTYLYFVKENGEIGYITANSYLPAGATLLKFTLPEEMCTKNMGESDLPCPSFITVTPGVYKVYAYPWGDKTNEVQFTVIK